MEISESITVLKEKLVELGVSPATPGLRGKERLLELNRRLAAASNKKESRTPENFPSLSLEDHCKSDYQPNISPEISITELRAKLSGLGLVNRFSSYAFLLSSYCILKYVIDSVYLNSWSKWNREETNIAGTADFRFAGELKSKFLYILNVLSYIEHLHFQAVSSICSNVDDDSCRPAISVYQNIHENNHVNQCQPSLENNDNQQYAPRPESRRVSFGASVASSPQKSKQLSMETGNIQKNSKETADSTTATQEPLPKSITPFTISPKPSTRTTDKNGLGQESRVAVTPVRSLLFNPAPPPLFPPTASNSTNNSNNNLPLSLKPPKDLVSALPTRPDAALVTGTGNKNVIVTGHGE